jgi:hypothetical protein
MRIKRSDRDMFGRPASETQVPAGQKHVAGQRRAVPPGLVPFLPVIAIVIVLAAFLIVAWLGVTLLVLGVALIFWLRYRDVKGIDYPTLRGADPWARAWDSFRRGTSWDDRNRP